MVVGTRPEIIKMSPLASEIKKANNHFNLHVCSTGQHRQLLDQAAAILDFQIDSDLNVMKPGQSLPELTSKILISLDELLRRIKPDLVLVHGDTTTALAATLASFYLNIPVGHVEAGMRTRNLKAPFPEEMNRQVIGRIANAHFSPTNLCMDNLVSEGISRSKIYVTGNTVVDSMMSTLNKIKQNPELVVKIKKNLSRVLPFPWETKKFILVTGHRRENFGVGFEDICRAIGTIAKRYPKVEIVYPLHLNPNVRGPVISILKNVKNVHLIDPLDYEEFLYVMKFCSFILSDSGGVQEEAPTLGKAVLIMRDNSERLEGLKAGTSLLVGSESTKIIKAVSDLLDNETLLASMSHKNNPYGDGKASKRIVDIIYNILHN
jgi:UDP-N-acetylglucosamine 2-epimerase (non-hydrolysing)